MVKFKSRYLLVESLYENDKIRNLDPSQMSGIIKKVVESLFGEIGLGKINKNLQIKYMNNHSNLMIVRVSKEHLNLLWTTLSLINEIDGEKVKLHVIGVSGTIKKTEIKAKNLLEKWLINYEKSK